MVRQVASVSRGALFGGSAVPLLKKQPSHTTHAVSARGDLLLRCGFMFPISRRGRFRVFSTPAARSPGGWRLLGLPPELILAALAGRPRNKRTDSASRRAGV